MSTARAATRTAAWEFLKFLTNQENSLRLTDDDRLGRRARQDVDWKPLLDKTPQFEVFVEPPKDMEYYVEPVLAPWDEIETQDGRQARRRLCRPGAERQSRQGRRQPSTRWRRRRTSS